ncbi:MAG: DUF4233 domain-containing protein [Microbacteriaceae bacterium]
MTTTSSPPPTGPRKARRDRSVTESLLSIVLVLEVILVFFVSLTAFGLKAVEPSTAFIGGAVLVIALAITGRVIRYQFGEWLGWTMQAVILATGLILPIMFVVGAVFLGLWIFCFVRGRQIDDQKASFTESTHPTRPTQE